MILISKNYSSASSSRCFDQRCSIRRASKSPTMKAKRVSFIFISFNLRHWKCYIIVYVLRVWVGVAVQWRPNRSCSLVNMLGICWLVVLKHLPFTSNPKETFFYQAWVVLDERVRRQYWCDFYSDLFSKISLHKKGLNGNDKHWKARDLLFASSLRQTSLWFPYWRNNA